jgi:hypothetical protein
MKKFILCMALIFTLFIGVAQSAENQGPCGLTYMYFYNEVTYLIKLVNSNPDLPCTSGKATLYWLNQSSIYDFTIDSNNFILVKNVGKLIVYGTELYFLDTATIIFDQWI